MLDIEQNESSQIIPSDESRPESVLLLQSESELIKTSKLYKILSNEKCADAYFIFPNETQIPSHRCILYESSAIFAKIIDETSESPVTINIADFDVETVKAVLEFLYGKIDSIDGKEIDAFKFAVKYNIQELMDSCCSFFEKSVAPSNN
uniref:BTB domain-containing protein n=1 Tax=Panagrolaimus superbus TaxID=310955 RepID=A0A914YPZ3_9BILA